MKIAVSRERDAERVVTPLFSRVAASAAVLVAVAIADSVGE